MKQSGLPTGFKFRKAIVKPEPSSLLAEFLGIMLGDGGVGPHQITITLNPITAADYADFVVDVIVQMFGFIPLAKNSKECLQHCCFQHRACRVSMPERTRPRQ
jgi:hypothetical protein